MHSQDILHRDIKLIHIVYSSPDDDLTTDLKLTGSRLLCVAVKEFFCTTIYYHSKASCMSRRLQRSP